VSGSTVSFAFVAGTVATVNSCGFALLPAYLARRVGAEDGTRRSADALSCALLVGAVTTAGFMLVFGTIGAAIGLGARELTRALPWAGLLIGVALALAGAAVLAGGHLRVRLPQLRYRGQRGGLRGEVLFGIGSGCYAEARALATFARTHPQAQVVGVDIQDSKEGARAFYRRFGWRHPSIVDSKGVIAARFGLQGLPATLFLDREHRVVVRILGETDLAGFTAGYRRALT